MGIRREKLFNPSLIKNIVAAATTGIRFPLISVVDLLITQANPRLFVQHALNDDAPPREISLTRLLCDPSAFRCFENAQTFASPPRIIKFFAK